MLVITSKATMLCLILFKVSEVSTGCKQSWDDGDRRCYPTCGDPRVDREPFQPPESCVITYKNEWTKCFRSPNKDDYLSNKIPAAIQVTSIELTQARDNTLTPVMRIEYSLPDDTNNEVVVSYLRSPDVADGMYTDPYYSKFPSWIRLETSHRNLYRYDKKRYIFQIGFEHLDNCNVYCHRTDKPCETVRSFYFLTFAVYSLKQPSLPAQSITYQVTTFNRRFKALPDSSNTEWKPCVMVAVLPKRGIQVVFEPLPPQMTKNNTVYEVSLLDSSTWARKMSKNINHSETTYYSLILDFLENGKYIVVVESFGCQKYSHACYHTTTVGFQIPGTTYPVIYNMTAAPPTTSPTIHVTTIVVVVLAVIIAVFLLVALGLTLRKMKATTHTTSRESIVPTSDIPDNPSDIGENLHRCLVHSATPRGTPSDPPNDTSTSSSPLLENTESKSVATRLYNFNEENLPYPGSSVV